MEWKSTRRYYSTADWWYFERELWNSSFRKSWKAVIRSAEHDIAIVSANYYWFQISLSTERTTHCSIAVSDIESSSRFRNIYADLLFSKRSDHNEIYNLRRYLSFVYIVCQLNKRCRNYNISKDFILSIHRIHQSLL
jgi:hypothetical protein